MQKVQTAEDFKLMTNLEAVRRILAEPKYAERLNKPLAYWTLPTDRSLPLAFLGRKVGDLLAASYEDLAATPGIGLKKISSLVMLLHRVAIDTPAESFDKPRELSPVGVAGGTNGSSLSSGNGDHGRAAADSGVFDPDLVSEMVWAQWQQTVRRHGLGHEQLGRLVASLQELPTVIWRTPLSTYLDRTLAEIRGLKTHGEKRVQVVLEVFFRVHAKLAHVRSDDGLMIRLTPGFIPPVEEWIDSILRRVYAPSFQEMEERFVRPLLKQVQVDAGPVVCQLAKGRLGVESRPQSVRVQSRRMGVTRARVYQLLDECGNVFEVRWPEGRQTMAVLHERLKKLNAEEDVLAFSTASRELLFPEAIDMIEKPVLTS